MGGMATLICRVCQQPCVRICSLDGDILYVHEMARVGARLVLRACLCDREYLRERGESLDRLADALGDYLRSG